MATSLEKVKTIIVVMMENRSFDHMLGYLSHPSFGNRGAAVDGIPASSDWIARFTNKYGGVSYEPFNLESLTLSGDPPHERINVATQIDPMKTGKPTMTGFVESYASNLRVSFKAYREVMGFYTPAQVPITAFLAENFVICDKWFAPLPTSTQPNRLMAMAGFTNTDNTFSDSVPNQDLVYDWCDRQRKKVSWRVYHEGWPFFMVMPRWRLKIIGDVFGGTRPQRGDVFEEDKFRPFTKFEEDFKSKDFPELVFVEPKYNDDHFSDAPPSDDHAPSSVAGGQAFLRKIYAAMVQNPERWASTVMIITYDENGGLFDHAEPLPIATADPNGSYESFATTGVRVPALIVSPLLQARKVFRKPLDHTSILKFIGSKFGDNGLYSEVVSARASVGSVKDILDEFGIEDARPCPEPPAFLTSIEVQPAADRPVNAMSQAFEHALLQARKEQPAEAAIKFRELEAFFGDSIGLWQLVQAELGAKGFRIASDCQYLVRTLVEAGEANLLKQPDRRTLAGSNLTLLANQMMVNAGKRGSHMVEEQDFYDARNQWCPLWPFC